MSQVVEKENLRDHLRSGVFLAAYKKCHYHGCTVNSRCDPTVRLFTVPKKNDARREEWLKCMGLSPSDKRTDLRCCVRHFAPGSFYIISNKLMKDARPNKFINENSDDGVNCNEKPKQPNAAKEVVERTPLDTPEPFISFHLAKPQQSTPLSSASANKQCLKRTTERPETMKDVLGKLGVSSAKALSPRDRILVDLIMKEKRARAAEKMRYAKLKEKLKVASSKEALWEKLAELTNRNLSDFCKRQAQLKRVKPNGRRFSFEDKMLAIQLGKKGCIAMKHLAILPSPKTINWTRLRHRMPMKCGFKQQRRFMNQQRSKIRVISTVKRSAAAAYRMQAIKRAVKRKRRCP